MPDTHSQPASGAACSGRSPGARERGRRRISLVASGGRERGIDSQESKRGLAVGVECRLDGCVNQTPHRMGTLVPRWPSDQTMMCAPVCARGPVAQTSMNSQPASLRIDGWHGTVLAIVWLLFLRRISSLALARSPTQENGSHCVTSDIVDLRRPHTRSDRFDRSSTRSTILLPEFETHTDAWLSGTRENAPSRSYPPTLIDSNRLAPQLG